MGHNTTVVVLNDALDQISKDKNFGEKLVEAICQLPGTRGQPVTVSAGHHGNAASVIESHHADVTKCILVGGNTGEDIGSCYLHGDEPKELQLARALAEEHGYSLRKKPVRK